MLYPGRIFFYLHLQLHLMKDGTFQYTYSKKFGRKDYFSKNKVVKRKILPQDSVEEKITLLIKYGRKDHLPKNKIERKRLTS